MDAAREDEFARPFGLGAVGQGEAQAVAVERAPSPQVGADLRDGQAAEPEDGDERQDDPRHSTNNRPRPMTMVCVREAIPGGARGPA